MSEENESTGPNRAITTIIGAAIIVLGVVIVVVVYNIHHHDFLAAQADNWARLFVRSSPVVEEQLGQVQAVKRVSEEHVDGKAPGWYLDYHVRGQDKAGTVEMRLRPNEYQGWRVPLAELVEGHHPPVNLR